MKNTMLKEREQIIAWLKENDILFYIIHNDLSVDVKGDVILTFKNLEFFPVQFNHVDGSFACHHNALKTLKGSPFTVSKNFLCACNELKSLEFSPRRVGKNFSCSDNQLENLKGISNVIDGNITADDNPLKNIDDLPVEFDGIFHHKVKNDKIVRNFAKHYLINNAGDKILSLTGSEIRKIQEFQKIDNMLPCSKTIKRVSSKI